LANYYIILRTKEGPLWLLQEFFPAEHNKSLIYLSIFHFIKGDKLRLLLMSR